MDFGFDNSSNNGTLVNNNHKWSGFGFLRSPDDLRDFKVAKTSSCAPKIPLQRSNLTEGHQQMLSFSSPNSQTMTLPYYHQTSTALCRSAAVSGYGSTGINAASMQGVVSGVRGPFTPSQWMELEHQALIYKYITANLPIPSYLLNPIRKAFEAVGFSTISGLRSNALGWGAFHLGFSNTDPEPGRCRRTDGKKWRCSRDAVADQKYCERHMNRGRHRSRKPVEGQAGHSASAVTTTTNAKLTATAAAVVPAGGGVSNGLGLSHQHQLTDLHSASNSHLSGLVNRNKENADGEYQHTTVLSMTSPKVSLKDNQYSNSKGENNAYEETSSLSEFGFVCSDSLLNPLNRSSSFVNCRNYATSHNLNDNEKKSEHALRQFMDNWPKNQTERSPISWPDVDQQPDRTQLSISIPMVTSDFMSSTSSPTNEKLTASPPRLPQELEMGLGVGAFAIERNQQSNWIPISWEPSTGGPLGEVLHTTSNSTGDCKNTKPLNLIDSWDNSPQLASSPTGVLQRSAFVSLSNSSAGSSPRAESSKICNGLIAPVVTNPSLPAL